MPELRWILVAVGVLCIAGLWVWEARRGRQRAARASEGDPDGPQDRIEPALGGDVGDAVADGPGVSRAETEVPVIRATPRERIGPADPPVVEIPADAVPELAPAPAQTRDPPPAIPYREMEEELDALNSGARPAEPPEDEYSRREPWVRTQPLERDQIRRAQEEEDALERARAAERPAGAAERELAAKQRIVALRLVSTGARWSGRTVVDALQAEGLVFGKYSVFHREHASGKSVYYVASMVEPGSFDLERADSLTYPGISLFAVVPGPVEAPRVFDMMLETGRRLADRLRGQLQDEQGSTLTTQRILNLREELVQLEHVARRLRAH